MARSGMTWDAIAARVIIRENDCWHYPLVATTPGYLQIRFEGRVYQLHRLFYERLVGCIPVRHVLHHCCEDRGCINPDHLQPMLHADHLRHHAEQRAQRHPRPPKPPDRRGRSKQTHCCRGHEFRPATTRYYPNGTKTCRLCDQIRIERSQTARKQGVSLSHYWISPEKRIKIREAYLVQRSCLKVARLFGTSAATVCKIVKEEFLR